jgi:PKD repeat protein
MERKRKKPHERRKEHRMSKTIHLTLLILLLIISSVQLVIADGQISIGFDPNPTQLPPYEPPSTVENIPPVANITGPLIGYVNQSLIFSAHYSHDLDGRVVEYRWDFQNDGLFDTEWTREILIAHSYSAPGNYTIKLQVKDNDQATGVTQLVIHIIQLTPPLQLPIAQANGPYQAYVNQTITFFSNDSYDPDGIIVNYSWDFGDRTLSYEKNPEHIYTKPGNYIAILTIRDTDNLSNIALASVYIREDKETLVSDISQSAPPIIPFMSLFFIFMIILFVTLYNLLIKPTKTRLLSTKQQKDSIKENGIDEKFEDTSIALNERTNIATQKPIQEKPLQKRHIPKPIGKSVFLGTDDEKLGDIIEIIRSQHNQIIGYKVKENKSKKELNVFAEHCNQQKNNYSYMPDNVTIPSKVMKRFEVCDTINPDIISLLKDNIVSKDKWEKIYVVQRDELKKNINHRSAVNKTVQNNLLVLKKQQTLLEDKMKELKRKKEKNMINQKQYQQMVRPYQQMLEDIRQNIHKYETITKRHKHTSSKKCHKRHK